MATQLTTNTKIHTSTRPKFTNCYDCSMGGKLSRKSKSDRRGLKEVHEDENKQHVAGGKRSASIHESKFPDDKPKTSQQGKNKKEQCKRYE